MSQYNVGIIRNLIGRRVGLKRPPLDVPIHLSRDRRTPKLHSIQYDRISIQIMHFDDMLRVSVLYDCCGKSEMILHIFEGVTQHHGFHAHVVVPCNNDDILTRKPTEMLYEAFKPVLHSHKVVLNVQRRPVPTMTEHITFRNLEWMSVCVRSGADFHCSHV